MASVIDFERLLEIARTAPALPSVVPVAVASGAPRVRIGVARDAAFSFYYEDNLEALERAGAELAFFSPLKAQEIPREIDALYIGGGFPEVHAAELAANTPFLRSVKAAAERGLPIYAECGGLMLLARSMEWKAVRYEMAGVLPVTIEVATVPQGHGYVELKVDRDNPFFAAGTTLRGHEFHYSGLRTEGEPAPTACAVVRGAGAYPGRDALIAYNVWAGYTHLHAAATPDWATALVNNARRGKQSVAGQI